MDVLRTSSLIVAAGPTVLAAKTGRICCEYIETDIRDTIWAYPLNGIVTILALTVQPLLAVIALVATPIFQLIGCCSDKFKYLADEIFEYAICSFSAIPELFVRIFNPSFELSDAVHAENLADHMHLSFFAAAPAVLAEMTQDLCDDYITENRAHGLWAYPLNGIVTILALTVQPILSVISIVVSAIFWQLGCCSVTIEELSKTIFDGAISGFTAIPELIVGIFNPEYNLGVLRNVNWVKREAFDLFGD